MNSANQRALQGELFSIEYRINVPDEGKRIVHSQGEIVFDEKGIPVRVRGTLQDVTERKMAEEALERINKIRIKEIHHRIKNNLQVISSLLDLQAEKFKDENVRAKRLGKVRTEYFQCPSSMRNSIKEKEPINWTFRHTFKH